MARRTREQIRIDNRPSLVSEYIKKNKYLRLPVHYKNNYWSVAHWESWAVQGKDGGCRICSEGHYNATLKNKRAKTKKDYYGKTKHDKYSNDVSCKCCSHCVKEIEKQIEFEIAKDYCR